MENDPNGQPETKASDLQALMSITVNGFERMETQFSKVEDRLLSVGRGLDGLKYTIAQLDQKVERFHQETKTDLTAIRGMMAGLSHSVADHEERIKELEGEEFA